MAVEVASAYVSLQASTRDLDRTIKAGLDKSVKHADAAGDRMGQRLSSALGKHLERGGTQSGEAFSKSFGSKVSGGGKTAMQGLAQAMLGGAEGIGSQVGGRFSGGLVAAISKGADGAVGALSKLGSGAGWSSGVVGAGAVAAAGVAVIGTAAVAAAGELYKIGEMWDGVADGITFKTGLVGDKLNAITDSIKNVASDTAASIGDISNVAAALTKGLKIPPGEGLEQLTQQIARYNAAAQENGADPINIREFIKAMKQMRIDGDVPAMQKQLDDLYKVTQNTTIPMNDLITALKTMGPQAQQFKIPATSLVQLLAAMEDSGLNTRDAMVGLKSAWKNLEDNPNPSQGLRDKINEIRGLLNSTSDEARVAGEKMATEFFGNKAGAALADAIRDGNLELDNFNTKATETGLTIGEMTENTEDFSQEWTKFKNWLQSDLEPVATAVFSSINKQLEFWTKSLKDGIQLVKDAINAVKQLIDGLPDFGNIGPGGSGGAVLNRRGLGSLNNNAGLKENAISLKGSIAAAFPQITDIGGYRANDKYPDHPSGRALDVMIPPALVGTPEGKALGDKIVAYAMQSGLAEYALWQQQTWKPGQGPVGMENRGSPTQNHMDHVHIYTVMQALQANGWLNRGGTFDTGGWLPPGYTLVRNATGDHELVLNPEQQKALAESGVDPQSLLDGTHQGSGAPPGIGDVHTGSGAAPGPSPASPSFVDNLIRTQGFTPTGGGGQAGTSSVAKFINMGNEVVGGLIDTGASLIQSAVTAATTAAGGAAAAQAGPAGPLAGMAASAAANYGIQLGAAELKRVSSYGFQLAGIGADALIAQMFPFGGPPRWMGYDYTAFAPQLGIQQAALTTIEQLGQQAIDQAFPTQGRPNPVPAAGPQELAAPPPPGPTVQIGSINGFSPEDVATQIDQRQRLAAMQFSGRP